MEQQLPHRPHLGHLRRQAKELLAQLRAGSPDAIREFIAHLPAAKDAGPAEVEAAGYRLADAQSVIARKSGFSSWQGLSRHVELLRALEGVWEFEALELEGAPIPPSAFAGARILMDGDLFRHESSGSQDEGEFDIDADAQPPHLDIHFKSGPEAGRTSQAIIRLDGDSLEICLGLAGRERPSQFSTSPGSGHAWERLRRTAPALAQPLEPIAPVKADWEPQPMGEEHFRLQGEWRAVSIVRDGHALPPRMVKDSRRLMNGVEMQVVVCGHEIIAAEAAFWPGDPIQMDLLILRGEGMGQVIRGVLEWRGDEFRTCLGAPGGERPDGFQSPPGSGWTLSAWRRA